MTRTQPYLDFVGIPLHTDVPAFVDPNAIKATCLLIEGIGHDMISYVVCNIRRGPLIRYTQDVCE